MVVNPRKNVSLKMSTGFHKKGVEDFIRNVAYGKTAGAVIGSFDKFAEISAVEAWDGKDGVVAEEVIERKSSIKTKTIILGGVRS